MEYIIHFNLLGTLASVVAVMIFGGLWYGPILGKAWAKEMGMSMDKKPEKNVMIKAFTLQIIGAFLIAFVLSQAVPYWGALHVALFAWIGFFIPNQFSKVAWERRSWKLFFINSPHDLINLLLITHILTYVI